MHKSLYLEFKLPCFFFFSHDSWRASIMVVKRLKGLRDIKGGVCTTTRRYSSARNGRWNHTLHPPPCLKSSAKVQLLPCGCSIIKQWTDSGGVVKCAMGMGEEDFTTDQGWGQLWDIYSPTCCEALMLSPKRTNQKRNMRHTWLDYPTLLLVPRALKEVT